MSDKEMQIEWERRVQLISPDLIVDNKPNSDTIFSFLNAAQDRYCVMNYVGGDQTIEQTNLFTKNVDAIKSLLVEKELTISGTTPFGFNRYRLPHEAIDEYFLYVNSVSNVNGTYKQYPDDRIIENTLVKYTDLPKYAKTAFNIPIIRKPAVAFMSDPYTKYNYLVVATDSYTDLNGVVLTYYRRPLRFGTSTRVHKCELPETVHSEIVDLAVDMFIAEAKYKLQIPQANRNEDNRDSGSARARD